MFTFNWNDELRDDRQDFILSLLEKIIRAKDSQESVRVEFLAESIKENGEIMMVVECFRLNFPNDLVHGSLVIDFNR